MKDPTAGNIFDVIIVPAADGLTGHGAGTMTQKVMKQIELNKITKIKAEIHQKGLELFENSEKFNSQDFLTENNILAKRMKQAVQREAEITGLKDF